MNCSKCQNELKPGALICGNCGTLVSTSASASAPVHVLGCLACGAPLAPGATVCGKCGASTATGEDDSNMTVILPRKAAAPSLATPAPPPVIESTDGATVILSAGKTPKPAAPVNDLFAPTMRLPERSAQADMSVRMPPVSMALEREHQHGIEDVEKKGKTVLVAVFSAIALLVLIAVVTGWYLMRESTPPSAAVPADVLAPLAEPQLAPEQSAPVASAPVFESAPSPPPIPVSEPASAVASTPTSPVAPQGEVSKPVSKPAAKPVKKLSEEEEYLRQIRRQLGR